LGGGGGGGGVGGKIWGTGTDTRRCGGDLDLIFFTPERSALNTF